jgi:hypothetical protein
MEVRFHTYRLSFSKRTFTDYFDVLAEIVERGDHKSLLAMKGIYNGLWSRQIRAEEEGATNVGKDTLKPTVANGESSRPQTPASGARVPDGHGHP